MNFAPELLVIIAFIAFAAKRLMIFLHALQQEDYDNERLLLWIREHKVVDRKLSIALFVLGGLFLILPPLQIKLLTAAALAFTAFKDNDPRKNSKKKLVLTARAKRIFFPAVIIASIIGALCSLGNPVWLIFAVQIIPASLVISNLLNLPYEKKIQQKYYDEAKDILKATAPQIIAVTGSYGKTSVKHILGHILKISAPTLITPGSVNTVMGITRIIREQMQPNTKYFIVEMGAYGPGSIERLCRLTPPDMGIITSIGQAHYERFKNLDTVAQTKFELAENVISRKGQVIIAEQTLDFEFTKAMYKASKSHFIVCGESESDDLVIKSIEQNQNGLKVTLIWKQEKYTINAPLYGIHHGANIAISFAAAAALGIEPPDIITALATVPQIPHRLEVKKNPDGSILIDDAYNSNPAGFAGALELLPVLKSAKSDPAKSDPAKARTILITPGMVELGAMHEQEHINIAKIAAKNCDIVLVITPERIQSFIDTFEKQKEAQGKILKKFDSFKEAEKWLQANRKPNDIILIENDLPDIYEHIPRL